MMRNLYKSGLALLGVAALLPVLGCGGSSSSGGPVPYDLTAASILVDLDGDGRLDPVNAVSTYGYGPPHSGFLSLRFQNASPLGSFRDPVRLSAGTDPYAIAFGDLNGDGRPDLVVANTQTTPGAIGSNTITVILSGATPGTFQPAQSLSLGNRDPLDVALGDLNHDGLADIAVASRGGDSVQVFFQISAGTFASPITAALGAEPTALTIADLNADGYMDLAVTTQANVSSVLLQNTSSAGTFGTPLNLSVGNAPVAVRSADINGDGYLDLAVVNSGSPYGGLSLLLQDASIPATFQFQATANYDTGDDYASALAIGDLNGDGRPEVVVTNAGAPGYPGSVAVFAQDPANLGHLLSPELYQGYYGPTSVAIGELNGDGHPDLLIADGDPSVRFQDPAQPGFFNRPVWLKH